MEKYQSGVVELHSYKNNRIFEENKTKKYMFPCLIDYGNTFREKISGAYKVAVGIGDMILKRRNVLYEKHLFVLFNSNVSPNFFKEFLFWIRKQTMYEDDYVFGNVQKSTLHMVVLKLPPQYHTSLEAFKRGEYSKMYSMETISWLFDERSEERKVLIKDKNYRVKFVENLNKIFDCNLVAEDYEGELDFPPKKESEIFNLSLNNLQ